MSEGFCKAFMLANVGADPELRTTAGGTPVLNLRVAANVSYQDKDKVRRERTSWFTCVCFGPRATALGKIIRKGDTLFIEAEPRVRSYDDRDGNKRTATEFHILDVKFCGGKGRGGAPAEDGFATPPRGAEPRHDTAPAADPGYPSDWDDNELAF